MATKRTKKATPKATATKKATPKATATKKSAHRPGQACLCGCGETTSRPGRRFRQGHDGRLKGMIIRQIQDARRSGDKATEKTAIAALKSHGWSRFVPAA